MILYRTCPSRRPARQRGGPAFILLEVLVAMVILGSSLAVIMQGFQIAMISIRTNKEMATGMILAQRLLDEYEFNSPEPGSEEGHFGEEFPEYRWERDVWTEAVNYRSIRSTVADNPFADMIHVHLRILRVDRAGRSELAFEAFTALTQAERFAQQSRLRNGMYPNELNQRRGRRR